MACAAKVSEGGCTGGDRGPYKLDLANKSVSQAIGPEDGDPTAQKFVQVEVAAVVNPRLIPVAFEVQYRPEKGDTVLLGTFALFPPDNPGKFIVPTAGRVGSNGSIVLSMAALAKTRTDDEVRVEVKRICFRRK